MKFFFIRGVLSCIVFLCEVEYLWDFGVKKWVDFLLFRRPMVKPTFLKKVVKRTRFVTS